MSEQNKELVRRAYQAISKGDFEAINEIVADDFVEHEEMPGMEGASGREAVVKQFQAFRAAFPDFSMTIEDMIAEGDKVYVRATMRGTHKGEFMDIPATGKQIAVPCGDLIRVAGGKAAEHWGVTDTGAMMQQLGVGS